MRAGTTFLVGVLLVALPLFGTAETVGDETETQAGGESGTDVKGFVRQLYVHGVPYDAAKKYASGDPKALLMMLEDEREALYWPNVTMVLGVSGDSALVRPLIDFVHGKKSPAKWSSAVYRGRTSGIMALGYLVHESIDGNVEAMRYLLDSATPASWNKRDIPWLAIRGDAEHLKLQMSLSAVLALALTGKEEAGRKLDELRNSRVAHTRIREVAESARPDWEEINTHGLLAYYQVGQESAAAPIPDAKR